MRCKAVHLRVYGAVGSDTMPFSAYHSSECAAHELAVASAHAAHQYRTAN
jgi:hypothetical protein